MKCSTGYKHSKEQNQLMQLFSEILLFSVLLGHIIHTEAITMCWDGWLEIQIPSDFQFTLAIHVFFWHYHAIYNQAIKIN